MIFYTHPVTDDSIKVRQLAHSTSDVHYDIGRRTLMFGVTKVGH